tara:strand:- start:1457 stop:2065 length:609 start_codon:yes stop_codon:yes gene_type:complete
MSLKFNYNNTEYVWLPVTRTATTSLRLALTSGISNADFDMEHKEEIENRKSLYLRTYNHLTYSESLLLNSVTGSEQHFSVVRNPMDRCVSLYNYMKSVGWLEGVSFYNYWENVLTNRDHDPIVSPAAQTSRLQKDIVCLGKDGGWIYKFESDLNQLQTDFGITLGTENQVDNVVTTQDIDDTRNLIESHFDDDYSEFGYDYG